MLNQTIFKTKRNEHYHTDLNAFSYIYHILYIFQFQLIGLNPVTVRVTARGSFYFEIL